MSEVLRQLGSVLSAQVEHRVESAKRLSIFVLLATALGALAFVLALAGGTLWIAESTGIVIALFAATASLLVSILIALGIFKAIEHAKARHMQQKALPINGATLGSAALALAPLFIRHKKLGATAIAAGLALAALNERRDQAKVADRPQSQKPRYIGSNMPPPQRSQNKIAPTQTLH